MPAKPATASRVAESTEALSITRISVARKRLAAVTRCNDSSRPARRLARSLVQMAMVSGGGAGCRSSDQRRSRSPSASIVSAWRLKCLAHSAVSASVESDDPGVALAMWNPARRSLHRAIRAKPSSPAPRVNGRRDSDNSISTMRYGMALASRGDLAELQVVEPGELALVAQQRRRRTTLHHAPALEHDHLVGVGDRCQAMRDDDDRAAARVAVERLLD